MFLAVEPSLRWFREQKKHLEPKLGERWAEGLYPADQTEEPAEVNHHRQVWLRVDCHKLVDRTQQHGRWHTCYVFVSQAVLAED